MLPSLYHSSTLESQSFWTKNGKRFRQESHGFDPDTEKPDFVNKIGIKSTTKFTCIFRKMM